MSRPKIIRNGRAYEMTDAEYAQYLADIKNAPPTEPTPEERIADLEEALALLLSGVTE